MQPKANSLFYYRTIKNGNVKFLQTVYVIRLEVKIYK